MPNIRLFCIQVHQNKIYISPTKYNNIHTTCLIYDKNDLSIQEAPLSINREGQYQGDKSVSYILGVFQINGKHFIVVVEECTEVAQVYKQIIYRIDSVAYIPIDILPQNITREITESLTNQKKLLIQGFYFSLHGDITLARQYQHKTEDSFCWNYQLLHPFREHHLSDQWMMPIIQGYVENFVSIVNNTNISLILISRRSRFMGGTRYNSRGLNDDGHVANFIETEQIVMFHEILFSFVMIRGSVPVFWQQESQSNCKLIRSKELTNTAFIKHFKLLKRYGSIMIVNLLQKNKSFEQQLTENFEYLLEKNKLDDLNYDFVDFHSIVKSGKSKTLNPYIAKYFKQIEKFQFYIFQQNDIKNHQKGTFRINCLDCLDRTNLYMSKIALVILNTQLAVFNLNTLTHEQCLDQFDESNKKYVSDLIYRFKHTWANNGDMLSKLYSGAGSTVSELAREGKRSFMGMLSDGMRNIERFYNSTFEDDVKQIAIDQLLYTQIQRSYNAQDQWLKSQEIRFSNMQQLSILVISWNVGGKEPIKTDFLETILQLEDQKPPDIIVFGLQEMVNLNPQNIMIMSNDKMQLFWDSVFQINLDKIDKYVKIQDASLVGIYLDIFVKSNQAHRISSIEKDQVKTGLGGTLGNKGAAAIKFKIDDSPIAFVCCHLASGNKQIFERLNEIDEIHQKAFQNSKSNHTLLSMDYCYFFGDTNFRLECPYYEAVDKIRHYQQLISKDKNSRQAQEIMSLLLNQDQLSKIKNQNQYLQNYQEGTINFLPTYKYDPRSEVYDTSKKQRTPSWCDRILLYSKEELISQQLFYNRRECYDSDHRPVTSYYIIEVKNIDKEKRNLVKSEYVTKQKQQLQDQFQQQQAKQVKQQQQLLQSYFIQPQIKSEHFVQKPEPQQAPQTVEQPDLL